MSTLMVLLATALTQAPPAVTGMSPAPGSTQSSPTSVVVAFSADLDPLSISAASVRLVGRGPDGVFDTGDDVIITPASVTVNGSVLTLDLTGQTLPNDVYRLTLSGTPSAAGPKAGVFGYWKFNEGTGSVISDSSGNGHTGNLNVPSWATGLFGPAFRMNGVDSYCAVDLGRIVPSWSFSIWVCRTGDVPTYSAVLLDTTVSNGTSLRLEQASTGDDVGFSKLGTADYGFGYTVPLNRWTHLVFTSDGSNVRLYANGVLQSTVAQALDLYLEKIGLWIYSTFSRSPLALVAEVQAYKRLLTAGEITSLADPGCLRSVAGDVLDGEFTGTLPSGDSAAGGNFVATFTVSTAPPPGPRVTTMVPFPGTTVTTAPAQILVTLDRPIDPATVATNTVILTRAGADGVFGTADDAPVIPNSVGLSGPNQVRIDLTGVTLPRDLYRVTLSGTTVLDPASVGWWTLDEAAGPTSADSSGSGNTGTQLNGPLVIPGKRGRALRLNGTSQSVTIASVASLSPQLGISGALSVSAWARVDTLPAAGTTYPILAKEATGQMEYGLHLRPDSSLLFIVDQLSGPIYHIQAQGGALATGGWHHLAGTFVEGTFCRVYLDGKLLQESVSFFGTTGSGSAPLQIGANGPTPNKYLAGDVDDVRIFNVGLTSAQVQNLATLGGALRDSGGTPLDGEFGGTFPSGDGTPGGNFMATFFLDVPGAFPLISPADNASDVPVGPTFTWGNSPGATSYTLQVSTDALFTNLVIDRPGIAGTSCTPGIWLTHSSTYHWRVIAVGAGSSTTSAEFTFVTHIADSVGAGGCGLSGLEMLIPLVLGLGRRRFRSRG